MDKIDVLDKAIDDLVNDVLIPSTIRIHPLTAETIGIYSDTYRGIEVVTDERIDPDRFYVNL